MKRQARPANQKANQQAKRRYRRASEAIVLERLQAGTLKVDTTRGMVYVKSRTGRWKVPHLEPNHGGYLFFRLYHRGARRRVALHRAVWIAAHGRLIPPEHEIHHESCDVRVNAANRLECLPKYAHKSIHYGDYPAEWDSLDGEAEF